MSSPSRPQENTVLSITVAQTQPTAVLHGSLSTPWQLLIAFGLFLLIGVALAWPSLTYPMVYDDLHLIRSFSPQELAQVWHSQWDVDGIETPGFRPLTPLFDHARFMLFGENVVAHRLFLVLLFAVYLTIITWIARQCGLFWREAIMGGSYV